MIKLTYDDAWHKAVCAIEEKPIQVLIDRLNTSIEPDESVAAVLHQLIVQYPSSIDPFNHYMLYELAATYGENRTHREWCVSVVGRLNALLNEVRMGAAYRGYSITLMDIVSEANPVRWYEYLSELDCTSRVFPHLSYYIRGNTHYLVCNGLVYVRHGFDGEVWFKRLAELPAVNVNTLGV